MIGQWSATTMVQHQWQSTGKIHKDR